jgi:hypothetical protein
VNVSWYENIPRVKNISAGIAEPETANQAHAPYNIEVARVVHRKPTILLSFLSSITPRNGAVQIKNIVATVKVRLNARSDKPFSITIHCAKYKKNTIETSEFAKSYNAQRKMFLEVCILFTKNRQCALFS